VSIPTRPRWQERLAQRTAGRILRALRGHERSVDELAREVSLTPNAVRAQLAALERDGLAHAIGTRAGSTKPSRTYALTADAELLFSRIYVPMLSSLMHVLHARLSPATFNAVMRSVGRELVGERRRPTGSLRERASAAAAFFDEFGAVSSVRRQRGGYIIQSLACPIAAVSRLRPEACLAMESLLGEFAGAPVVACCAQSPAEPCCFEIGTKPRAPGATRRRAS
jgi:predicted ArsR family transcriptional regulator